MKAGQNCGFNRTLTLPLKKPDVISEKSRFFSPLALKKSLKYIITHCGHQQISAQKTNNSKAAVKHHSKFRYGRYPLHLRILVMHRHTKLFTKVKERVLHAGEEAMPNLQEDA